MSTPEAKQAIDALTDLLEEMTEAGAFDNEIALCVYDAIKNGEIPGVTLCQPV